MEPNVEQRLDQYTEDIVTNFRLQSARLALQAIRELSIRYVESTGDSKYQTLVNLAELGLGTAHS